MDNKKYAEWVRTRRPVSPIFSEIMLAMAKNGELDNLEGDDMLEKVADAAEMYIEGAMSQDR